LSGIPENFQGAHTYGASRGHLCDSSAFLWSEAIAMAADDALIQAMRELWTVMQQRIFYNRGPHSSHVL